VETDCARRRFFLAQGFLGAPLALSHPRASFAFRFSQLSNDNPFEVLRDVEATLRDGEALAGYLSYECIAALEPSLSMLKAPLSLPVAMFAVYTQTEDLRSHLSRPRHCPAPVSVNEGDGAATYGERVENIRQRIAAGDLFQVNYSHRQSATFEKADALLIDRLPWADALEANYGALIDLGSTSIISASPELFLELEDGVLATEPIKGTRPRHDDPQRDAASLHDLEQDPKDRAENIMIADLMRNDLAKVSDDGSIREVALAQARSYPAVHHLYSRIEGRLRPALGFSDALAAAFPCGSVTGAPKMAAIEAITALEGEGRGAYCGTVFAITKKRSCASVAIRTAMVDENEARLDVRSGGGVTILSDPKAEYHEALDKGYLFRQLTGRDDPRH